jgi:hypothetical protein
MGLFLLLSLILELAVLLPNRCADAPFETSGSNENSDFGSVTGW